MKKLLLSVGIAAAILAGCNSSSSGGGITPVPGPTVAPTTVPTATPVGPSATPVATPAVTASPSPSPSPSPAVTGSPSPSPSPSATGSAPAVPGSILLSMVPANFTAPVAVASPAAGTSQGVFNYTGNTVPQAATTGSTAPTTGPNETANLNVTEAGYTGSFSATTCTNAPPISIGPPTAIVGGVQYTVTALTPGQCSIIVNDTLSRSQTILVNVPATLTATVS